VCDRAPRNVRWLLEGQFSSFETFSQELLVALGQLDEIEPGSNCEDGLPTEGFEAQDGN
jgi:hypothetical protein